MYYRKIDSTQPCVPSLRSPFPSKKIAGQPNEIVIIGAT